MTAGLRLPDYVIVGIMKSGTTSLYQWLGQQRECVLAKEKEPDYFSRDEVWQRGIEWYSALFADAPDGTLTGEASTSYTKPSESSRLAARRMAQVVPDVRILCVLRHPVERLRSHYRHQLRRSRERRPLLQALRDPGNEYLALSRYHACLEPYLETFPREQICVVRFDDLVSESAPGWTAVLHHLGLSPRPAPATQHNTSAAKPQYTRAMLRLWSSGYYDDLRRLVPRRVRRLAQPVLLREKDTTGLFTASEEHLPEELVAPVWEDLAQLEQWLGVGEPLWSTDEKVV